MRKITTLSVKSAVKNDRTLCAYCANFFQFLEFKVKQCAYKSIVIFHPKETPNDAQVVSHQLMLRAGMIRPMASGFI